MSEHERVNLGAFVLGQLPPVDAARVEAHLAGCASCRLDRDEIAPAAAALSAVRDTAATTTGPAALPGPTSVPGPTAVPAPTVPPELASRVWSTVASEQRRAARRRWAWTASIAGVGAGAAAAVLVVGLVVFGPDEPRPARVPLEAVSVQVERAGITADAALIPHTWGVEVRLTATGFGAGQRYRVDIVGTDGARHPAGEFVGVGARRMVCSLNSSVLRSGAEGFEVMDAGGTVVVVSHFPH